MKNYRDFLGNKSETWHQAIDRYQHFCHADMAEYFSSKGYSYKFADNKSYVLKVNRQIPVKVLTDFEPAIGFNVPSDLKAMLSTYGPVSIGDNLFEMFDNIHRPAFVPFTEVFTDFGMAEIIGKVKPAVSKSISGFYSFFGVSFKQSDEVSFLFFSKAGNFGKLLYRKANPDDFLNNALPAMFNGSFDKYSLDQLISNQIDRIITNALTVRGYIE